MSTRFAIDALLLMSVMLSGCQLSWPFQEPAPLFDNARFMATWETYRHCRASTEPGEIRADLERLHDAAHAARDQTDPPLLVPTPIRSLMTTLPSRLAVDPYAMTVACALHGREVAETAGQHDVARELLMRVVMVANSRSSTVAPDHGLLPGMGESPRSTE
jgi:hypothetical protein